MWQTARRHFRFGRNRVLFVFAILACFGAAEARAQRLESGDRIMGSLSSVGSVSLRGVRVADEATVFAGDRIQTSRDSWVAVSLADGGQLELAGDTDVEVGREASGVRLAMTRGRIAVTSSRQEAPLRVDVESLEILAQGGATAEIAFLEPRRLRVTALKESLSFSRQDGQESETVEEGEQRIINLDADVQPEAGTEDESDDGSSSKTWVFVGAGAGGGAGVAILLSRNEASPSAP
jgi:ferric-dicitrate binding protein FerR (iron transport regulator)